MNLSYRVHGTPMGSWVALFEFHRAACTSSAVQPGSVSARAISLPSELSCRITTGWSEAAGRPYGRMISSSFSGAIVAGLLSCSSLRGGERAAG